MLPSESYTFDIDGTPLKLERFKFVNKPPIAEKPQIKSCDDPGRSPAKNSRSVSHQSSLFARSTSEFVPGPASSWIPIENLKLSPGVTVRASSGEELKGPPLDRYGRLSRSEYRNLVSRS